MNRISLKKSTERRNYLGLFIFIIAVNFVLFLMLNNMTGYVADDFIYFFKYREHSVTPGLTRVQNISDIIEGMKNHYSYSNGRLPAHFLLQLFLLFDKSVFNFFNTLFFIGLGLLMYYHSTASFKRLRPLLLVFIFGFLWLSFGSFGVIFLWYSAAFNYLWTTVMILLFLLPFRLYSEKIKINDTEPHRELLKAALIVIPGILAGWSNENMGGAAVLAIILYLLYFRVQKAKIRPWHWSALFSSAIGFSLILLSPANSARLNRTKGETDFFERLPWSLSRIMEQSWKAMALFAAVLLLIWLASRFYGADKKAQNIGLSMIYFVSGLMGAVAMVFSPEIPARSFTGSSVFMATAAFLLFSALFSKLDFDMDIAADTVLKVACIAIICTFEVVYISNYKNFLFSKSAYDTTEDFVKAQKASGVENIVVANVDLPKDSFSVYSRSKNLIHNPNNSAWLNSWMSEYYGVDSITIINNQ